MKSKLKNIVAGIGYLILFLGINVLVSLGVEIAFEISVGMNLLETGAAMPTREESLQMYMEFYSKYVNVITIICQTLTLLVIGLILKLKKKELRKELKMVAFDRKAILPIIALGLGVQLFVNYGIELLPIPKEIMDEYLQVSTSCLDGSNVFLEIIAVAIIAPIAEEIMYRGLVLEKFKKAVPTVLAVIICSCLFGLGHSQLIWVIYTTGLGILFSVIAIREQSLIASILLHMIFNFSGLHINSIPCNETMKGIFCIVGFVMMIAMMFVIMRNGEKAKNRSGKMILE